MFIMNAKHIDKILSNLNEEPLQVEFQFKMHRDAIEFYRENRNAVPTIKNYDDAAIHISELFGVIVDREQIEVILSLFPSARIKLAVYDGCEDSEVRDLIAEAASVYFSGSKMPTFGDKIDTDRFHKHIQSQAEKMGFMLVE